MLLCLIIYSYIIYNYNLYILYTYQSSSCENGAAVIFTDLIEYLGWIETLAETTTQNHFLPIVFQESPGFQEKLGMGRVMEFLCFEGSETPCWLIAAVLNV